MSFISKDFSPIGVSDNTQPSAEGLANFECCARNSKGNPNALRALGLQHLVGKGGCEKSTVLAFMYFQLAADEGDPVSQFDVGFCYKNGIGTPVNRKASRKYYQMAADNGVTEINSEAIRILLKKDVEQREVLKPDSELKTEEPQTKKSNTGSGAQKTRVEVFKETLQLAKSGDAHAQWKVGSMYINGDGTKQSSKAAFKYFLKSANNGYSRAQLTVGSMYRGGKNVEQSFSKAYKYYDLAYMQGNKSAVTQRDLMLEGIFPNYPELLENDTPEALCELAKIHQKIAGTYASAAAFKILHKAADFHNDKNAQYELAKMYDTLYTQASQETAKFYYSKAAEQGHNASRLMLLTKQIKSPVTNAEC